jgi:hypothetical protein
MAVLPGVPGRAVGLKIVLFLITPKFYLMTNTPQIDEHTN